MSGNALMSATRLVKLVQCVHRPDAGVRQADSGPANVDAYRQSQALVETYLRCKGPNADLARKRAKIMQVAETLGATDIMEQAVAVPWAHLLAERSVRAAYGALPGRSNAPRPSMSAARHALERKSLPFAPVVRERLRHILGTDVHPDFFRRTYAALADAWMWAPVTAAALHDGGIIVRIVAHDDARRPILTLDRVLRRAHHDGLEMFAQATHLDPRARGQRVLLDLEGVEQQLLRRLCPHPRTRIVRIAGLGFGSHGWGASDPADSLLAARCGYLDAAYFNVSLAHPPPNRPYTVTEVINAAKSWVDDEPALFKRRGDKPLDAKRSRGLLADLQRFENAYELLRWEHPDVTVQLPGEAATGELGRAFFLHRAPPWCAVRFVWGPHRWEQHIAANPTPSGWGGLRLGDRQVQGALQKLVASALVFAGEQQPAA